MNNQEYYKIHVVCPECRGHIFVIQDGNYLTDGKFIDSSRVTSKCGWSGIVDDLKPKPEMNMDALEQILIDRNMTDAKKIIMENIDRIEESVDILLRIAKCAEILKKDGDGYIVLATIYQPPQIY